MDIQIVSGAVFYIYFLMPNGTSMCPKRMPVLWTVKQMDLDECDIFIWISCATQREHSFIFEDCLKSAATIY